MKILAKHVVLYASIAFLSAFVAVGGVTYYVLNHLQEETASNQNLVEVMKIGEGYMAELDSFASLQQMLQNKKFPPFCATLCNPSNLSQDLLLSDRTPYLTEYYQNVGTKALQDPMFRFKLEQMSSVSRAVPIEVRGLLKDLLNKESLNTKNKALLALKVETTLMTQLPGLSQRLENYKIENDRLGLVRTWIKACQMGANARKIASDCEARLSQPN